MLNLTTARVTGWGGLFSQDPASLTNTAQRLSCYLQEVELDVEIPGSVETRGVTTSLVFSHWSRNVIAWLSLVESFPSDAGASSLMP